MSDLVEEEEVQKLLKKIPEWDHENKKIFRVIEFDEFMDGIDFVDGVAENRRRIRSSSGHRHSLVHRDSPPHHSRTGWTHRGGF